MGGAAILFLWAGPAGAAPPPAPVSLREGEEIIVGVHTIIGRVNKGGTATVLAIVTARNGSGNPAIDKTGKDVGNAVRQADLASITCQVTDTGTTPESVIANPTVTIATSIYDVIQAGGLWNVDNSTGYNFLHDLPPTCFPRRDRTYRVVYTFNMADGVTVGIGELLLTS